MEKKELRKAILSKRSQIDAEYRRYAPKQISDTLKELLPYQSAKMVASFVSFRDELEMTLLNQSIRLENKTLVLPYISMEKHEMHFYRITEMSELIKNDYGLYEPNPKRHIMVPNDAIDLFLTPGVAFSLNGYRLGYGGGFYDRLFSKLSKATPKIGIAFDMQVVPELPVDVYDQPITHLITEKKLYTF